MVTQFNIAVIEDHDALREVMIERISAMGYRVLGASCADDFDELLIKNRFDLLILDLNLPGEDGLSIAQRMRLAHPEIFIIMMTARGAEEDRVTGYQLGADIYLPKTSSLKELEAAIASLARRKQANDNQATTIVLDPQQLMLIGKHSVSLGKAEVLMLKAMVEAPNQRLDYWRILDLLEKEVNDRNKATLEVAIVRLRKKLAQVGAEGDTIKSLHKEGYQLLCPLAISE